MPNTYWKQFKSGSDIRGIASGDPQKINLTNDVIEKIAVSFAVWIANKTWTEYRDMTIAVGNDPRASSMRLKTAVTNALTSIGVKIYDCSLTSTPAMLMAVSSLTCTASLQITASHQPADRNGIKFFTSEGSLSAKNIDEILEIAQSGDFPPISYKMGEVKPINVMNYYCEKIKNVITENLEGGSNKKFPLQGLKIAVDAGNGSGGFFANDILKPLGADVSGSIFLNPDGNFPNHMPNPEDESAIKALSEAVIKSKSDIGIIFDTDVDRVGIVDCHGQMINRNKLIAFTSAMVLEKNPGATIVTDSVTSDKLSEYIQDLGGTQFRYKRGYRNVIEYAQQMNASGINCPLAIESSGHAALRENNFVDDGAYLAAKVIANYVKMKKENVTIDDVLKNFVDAKEQIEIRITINDSRIVSSSRHVLTGFKRYIDEIKSSHLAKNNLEGVRASFKARWQEGWCILRKSVHDPVLVLNIESYVHHGAISILNSLLPFFERFQFIDMDEIKSQIHKIESENTALSEV